MSAIHVTQFLPPLVVLAKKQRRISSVRSVFKKQSIHRPQERLRLVQRDRALAPQIRLQVRHQQCSGNPFARDVAQHQAQPLLPQIQKVVIISAHLPRLHANPRVLQRRHRRQTLRKESRLYFPRNLQFARRSPLRLLSLFRGPAFRLHRVRYFVITRQHEQVPVHVAKMRHSAAPYRRFRAKQQRLLGSRGQCLRIVLDPPQPRRRRKSHALLRPFLKSRRNIVCQKYDLRRPSNQLRFLRFCFRLHQRQHSRPVRRRHRHPPLARLQLRRHEHLRRCKFSVEHHLRRLDGERDDLLLRHRFHSGCLHRRLRRRACCKRCPRRRSP